MSYTSWSSKLKKFLSLRTCPSGVLTLKLSPGTGPDFFRFYQPKSCLDQLPQELQPGRNPETKQPTDEPEMHPKRSKKSKKNETICLTIQETFHRTINMFGSAGLQCHRLSLLRHAHYFTFLLQILFFMLFSWCKTHQIYQRQCFNSGAESNLIKSLCT